MGYDLQDTRMQIIRPQGVFSTVLVVFIVMAFQPFSYALDSSKYIGIDEIDLDMEAYFLTVNSGTEAERFELKTLSIVRNYQPGKNMILTVVTDERIQKGGAVHGCSGSPVYIDGRLAGALAAGWDGALEPLYLVRPIEEMLQVGVSETASSAEELVSVDYDFTRPLNLDDWNKTYFECLQFNRDPSQMLLPVSSTLPTNVLESYKSVFESSGMMAAASGALLPSRSFPEAGAFEPGGMIALVLCGGDISLSATGTVTDVVDDQVFAFGHHFQGRGAVNYPIAAGIVHTIVPSRSSSFKYASPGPIIGTLDFDKSTAVRGTIGKSPKTIDLTIGVDRYNDIERRKYDCYLAVDRQLTPLILQAALRGAVEMQGALPPEHTIRYSGSIVTDTNDKIEFNNLSSQRDLLEVVLEASSSVGMLLNNPFDNVRVDSIDIQVKVEPGNMTASVWAVNVNQTKIRPGDKVSASVVLRSYRSKEETVNIDLEIPKTLAPGKYKIEILGPSEYERFVTGTAPHMFRASDAASLKAVLSRILQYRRDQLYAVMQTPSTGLVIREDELGQLPPTKMLLMQDSKRLVRLEPYKMWTENSITLDKIVQGKAEIEITVER